MSHVLSDIHWRNYVEARPRLRAFQFSFPEQVEKIAKIFGASETYTFQKLPGQEFEILIPSTDMKGGHGNIVISRGDYIAVVNSKPTVIPHQEFTSKWELEVPNEL